MSGILIYAVAILVGVLVLIGLGVFCARTFALRSTLEEWEKACERERSLRQQAENYLQGERARLRDELEDQKGALQYFEERSNAIVAERVQECLEKAKAPLREEIAELRLRIESISKRRKQSKDLPVVNRKARELVKLQKLENERICPECGEHCIMMRDEGGE